MLQSMGSLPRHRIDSHYLYYPNRCPFFSAGWKFGKFCDQVYESPNMLLIRIRKREGNARLSSIGGLAIKNNLDWWRWSLMTIASFEFNFHNRDREGSQFVIDARRSDLTRKTFHSQKPAHRRGEPKKIMRLSWSGIIITAHRSCSFLSSEPRHLW